MQVLGFVEFVWLASVFLACLRSAGLVQGVGLAWGLLGLLRLLGFLGVSWACFSLLSFLGSVGFFGYGAGARTRALETCISQASQIATHSGCRSCFGFKMRLQFSQIYGPSRGAAFGSLFWGCFIVWYKEVPFLGSPSGLQNGARSRPRIHVFFGPKEEPQTQLVVISCSWVLLWFGVPCFGALKFLIWETPRSFMYGSLRSMLNSCHNGLGQH